MNPFFMYEKRQGIEEVFDCNICIEGFRSADDHFDKSRKEHKEASINIYESTPFLTTIDLTTMFIRWFHNYQNSITLQLRESVAEIIQNLQYYEIESKINSSIRSCCTSSQTSFIDIVKTFSRQQFTLPYCTC